MHNFNPGHDTETFQKQWAVYIPQHEEYKPEPTDIIMIFSARKDQLLM
jgi:hypothetical protein